MASHAIITWNASLSCGVTDIDEDHKKLVSMINRLGGAVLSADPQEVLQEILRELVQYVVFHFDREEEYMQEYDYPRFEQHQAQHRQLLDQAQEFVELLGSRPTQELWQQLGDTLRAWLVVHIEGEDHELGAFLVNQGLS
ncbi:MAG: hemerythrin family protein [Magnetococcales bacterium]|nr:hemerythrin family protein [Magnetococcales bacterium]